MDHLSFTQSRREVIELQQWAANTTAFSNLFSWMDQQPVWTGLADTQPPLGKGNGKYWSRPPQTMAKLATIRGAYSEAAEHWCTAATLQKEQGDNKFRHKAIWSYRKACDLPALLLLVAQSLEHDSSRAAIENTVPLLANIAALARTWEIYHYQFADKLPDWWLTSMRCIRALELRYDDEATALALQSVRLIRKEGDISTSLLVAAIGSRAGYRRRRRWFKQLIAKLYDEELITPVETALSSAIRARMWPLIDGYMTSKTLCDSKMKSTGDSELRLTARARIRAGTPFSVDALIEAAGDSSRSPATVREIAGELLLHGDEAAVETLMSKRSDCFTGEKNTPPAMIRIAQRAGLPLHEHANRLAEFYERCVITTRETALLLSNTGKQVAVVGNSPCELGKGRGSDINAHDIVVRFNRFSVQPPYDNDYCHNWSAEAKLLQSFFSQDNAAVA